MVEDEDLDIGTGASIVPEAQQVDEGDDGPSKEHEDEHRVQEMVFLQQYVHISD